MRIGAKVPNTGSLPARRGLAAMAAELEQAGFDSLWVSDHIVMPAVIRSAYPFAADGAVSWPADTPYLDAMIALAVIAAATQRVTIGTAVLVLPLRQPVVLAKQAASIDVISGGRLELGIGAGWLAEEFEALQVPFGSRGERLTEWVQVLRACWTGAPPAFSGRHYQLPAGMLSGPPPPHPVPLLIGGHSAVARSRAASLGDGWLPQQSATGFDLAELRDGAAELRGRMSAAGRDPGAARIVLRIVDSARRAAGIAAALPALAEAGVTEIIVDIDWTVPGAAAASGARLRAATGRTMRR
jgi:probable F420-dependent oxidoreductase